MSDGGASVELGGPGVPKPHQRFTGDAFELLIWLVLPASRRAVAAKMPSNGCGGAVRLHCAYPFSCSCGASQNPCRAIFLSNFTLLHCCRAVRLPYSFRIPWSAMSLRMRTRCVWKNFVSLLPHRSIGVNTLCDVLWHFPLGRQALRGGGSDGSLFPRLRRECSFLDSVWSLAPRRDRGNTSRPPHEDPVRQRTLQSQNGCVKNLTLACLVAVLTSVYLILRPCN